MDNAVLEDSMDMDDDKVGRRAYGGDDLQLDDVDDDHAITTGSNWNLDVTDSHQALAQGVLSQGLGGHGMTEDLLTDVTAPDSDEIVVDDSFSSPSR